MEYKNKKINRGLPAYRNSHNLRCKYGMHKMKTKSHFRQVPNGHHLDHISN
jgi:hypothetical protein